MKGDESGIPIIDHEYLPLDLVAEEIRLLVIKPSKDPSSPLVAHLTQESIYGKAVYQCLSYTWGDAKPSEDLIMSGQRIKITKNLYSALRAIRHPTDVQVVWADAVCTNQHDTRERSRQVSRMHKIFEMADCVIIWLGDDDEDSDVTMDFVAELGRPEWTAFEGDGFKLKWGQRLAVTWTATYKLLQRPYFRWLWIVQELALASSPTVFCGKKGVAWTDLHNASMRIRMHQNEIEELCSHYGVEYGESTIPASIVRQDGCPNCHYARNPGNDLQLAHKLSWHRHMRTSSQSPTFLYLCLLNRDTECSDSRDKIYALWNLACEVSNLNMRLNYSLSVGDIYISFAKSYIETTRSLDITCVPHSRCRLGPESSHSYERIELPSWVPDWRG